MCRDLIVSSGNKATFFIECETWQVDVMMVIVNLDYVALSSVLPACVCVCILSGYIKTSDRNLCRIPMQV